MSAKKKARRNMPPKPRVEMERRTKLTFVGSHGVISQTTWRPKDVRAK